MALSDDQLAKQTTGTALTALTAERRDQLTRLRSIVEGEIGRRCVDAIPDADKEAITIRGVGYLWRNEWGADADVIDADGPRTEWRPGRVNWWVNSGAASLAKPYAHRRAGAI